MLAILIVCIIFHIASFYFVESYNFTIPSFDSNGCGYESSIICMGSVVASSGSLDITPYHNQQQQHQSDVNKVGRVLFRHPVMAWPASFCTIFAIRILVDPNSTESGDGMAFIMAQDDQPSPPESYGMFLGILDPSAQGGGLRQLAVEFDTYKNGHEQDGNHIAINSVSMADPIVVKSLSSTGINLKSGRDIVVKIEYDGWNKMLQISVAYDAEPLASFLNQKIIMENTVPQFVYVGFTASTGFVSETHQVLGWNFTLYQLPEKSLRLGLEEKDKTMIVLMIVIPVVLVLFLVVAYGLGARRRKNGRGVRKEDFEMLTRNAANAPRMFTYKQLSKATRKFSKENLLGSGGFGSVYKGILSDPSTIVAVKKINATSKQGEREYFAEICTIGRLRHKNLVQLQGWCHDSEELLLVYEYIPNGSLDRFIGKGFLDWGTRYKILLGLSSVLVYLHEECGNPVVHRDVKPNNVMLDSDYNAHLGDFGLARLLQNDAAVTTIVAGTPGYMAPEVSYTGRATPESDVYSFGMVVLEVVCGCRSKCVTEENSLVDCVWSSYEKCALLNSVDKKLEGKLNEEEAQRALIVGLACLHPDYMLRPKMRKVAQIFMNPDEPVMNLPESRPSAVCLSLYPSSASNTTTDFCNSSIAQAGVSMESFCEEL